MKLLTHNFLQCHVKGVKNGYPLKIEAAKVEQRDADYDPGRYSPAAAQSITSSRQQQQQQQRQQLQQQQQQQQQQQGRYGRVSASSM
jgi:transcription initiation factor TFIID subunit TAF12